jgi:hypothetical protein
MPQFDEAANGVRGTSMLSGLKVTHEPCHIFLGVFHKYIIRGFLSHRPPLGWSP